MTGRVLVAAAVALCACKGAYQYYGYDTFGSGGSPNSQNVAWRMNGTQSSGTGTGLTSTGAGAMIDTAAVPTGSSYEVKMTLDLQSSGGYYIAYLRASPDALLTTTGATGSFYAIYVVTPSISGNTFSQLDPDQDEFGNYESRQYGDPVRQRHDDARDRHGQQPDPGVHQ